jgi:hypothetical protein
LSSEPWNSKISRLLWGVEDGTFWMRISAWLLVAAASALVAILLERRKELFIDKTGGLRAEIELIKYFLII